MIYKTLYRKLKIEQGEPTKKTIQKQEVDSGASGRVRNYLKIKTKVTIIYSSLFLDHKNNRQNKILLE